MPFAPTSKLNGTVDLMMCEEWTDKGWLEVELNYSYYYIEIAMNFISRGSISQRILSSDLIPMGSLLMTRTCFSSWEPLFCYRFQKSTTCSWEKSLFIVRIGIWNAIPELSWNIRQYEIWSCCPCNYIYYYPAHTIYFLGLY